MKLMVEDIEKVSIYLFNLELPRSLGKQMIAKKPFVSNFVKTIYHLFKC